MPARKKKTAQTHSLWLAVVVAGFVGFLVGFVVFSWLGSSQMFSDETMELSDHSHMYDRYDVPDGVLVPTISVEVTQDAVGGYNVHLSTENFVFAPENASGEHVDGQGHAHIYVDGVKVGRVYSEWYHLGDLDAGDHTVRVTLNTNDHMEYSFDGQVVSDSVEVSSTGVSDSYHMMGDAMDSEDSMESMDGESMSN